MHDFDLPIFLSFSSDEEDEQKKHDKNILSRNQIVHTACILGKLGSIHSKTITALNSTIKFTTLIPNDQPLRMGEVSKFDPEQPAPQDG